MAGQSLARWAKSGRLDGVRTAGHSRAGWVESGQPAIAGPAGQSQDSWAKTGQLGGVRTAGKSRDSREKPSSSWNPFADEGNGQARAILFPCSPALLSTPPRRLCIRQAHFASWDCFRPGAGQSNFLVTRLCDLLRPSGCASAKPISRPGIAFHQGPGNHISLFPAYVIYFARASVDHILPFRIPGIAFRPGRTILIFCFLVLRSTSMTSL